MANKSDCLPKNAEVQSPVYHSQTNPLSELHTSREVQSIATDSHDISPNDKGNKLEHKKSSFKRLMA